VSLFAQPRLCASPYDPVRFATLPLYHPSIRMLLRMQPNDTLGASRSSQSDLACHPPQDGMLLQVQPNSRPGTGRHDSRQFATLHIVGRLMTGSCRSNATASTYHAGLTVAAHNGAYQHGYGHRARLLSLVAVELSRHHFSLVFFLSRQIQHGRIVGLSFSKI